MSFSFELYLIVTLEPFLNKFFLNKTKQFACSFIISNFSSLFYGGVHISFNVRVATFVGKFN